MAKRKAILDGMLFEVFFDSEAKLRPDIKGGRFDDLFDLQKHESLSESFDFIAEALMASRGSFYVVPGKRHELSVTVKTVKSGSDFIVKSVYVDGADVLRLEDEEYATDDDGERHYFKWSDEKLEAKLARDLLVPSRLAKFTYAPAAASEAILKFPMGFTVKKA